MSVTQRKQQSANQEYDALKAALRTGDPERLYLFHGEESYLREYYLGKLRDLLTDGPAAEFNTHKFDGRTLSIETLTDAIEALPMMAERSFVEVDDFDLFGTDESTREKLVALLNDLPEYVCLVFVFDTVPYKPDGRLRKLTNAIAENGRVVEFRAQNQRELSAWIARHFRAAGKTIAPKLAEYLIFLTDGTMTTLHSEIGKIIAFVTGDAISRSDIDMVVEKCLDAQVFDITDAMAKQDFDAALNKLHEVLALQSDPIRVLAAIGSNIRKMSAALTLSSAGKGPDAIAALYTIKPYAAQMTLQSARKFSRSWCDNAVVLCMQTDYQIKSSTDDPQRLLELLIVQLAQEARRG